MTKFNGTRENIQETKIMKNLVLLKIFISSIVVYCCFKKI